jgi:hypothetical protein
MAETCFNSGFSGFFLLIAFEECYFILAFFFKPAAVYYNSIG